MEASAIRDLLNEERTTTLNRIGAMTAEFDEIVAATAGSNTDDEHDPEGSTIAFERAQVSALLLEAQAYLAELDRALAKVDAGRYGTCERCGAPIGAERLAARPATESCVSCAALGRSVSSDLSGR
jgi:DnaK suppressor protein